MGVESDLLQRKAVGWNFLIAALLEQRGMSPETAAWLQAVLPVVELIAFVGVLAAAAATVDRLWCGRVRADLTWWVLGAIQIGAALVALRLLYWIYQHPSGELGAVPCRWDYLAFAILGGLALRRIPLQARIWFLAVLSIVLLDAYVGRGPFLIVVAGCLAGFAATRWSVSNRPGRRVVVQGVLMAAVLVTLWQLRSSNPFGALLGWAFFSFAMFRHVSFVVESARGVPVTLGGYLCFLLFYPNSVGAMEVYNEFWEHNLVTEREREYRRSAQMVAKGTVLLWIAVMIPLSDSQIRDSVGFVSMWTNVLVVFFRAASGSMGLWNIIEGGALFLGMRLRPNFRGVLTATNPSQFWRAWRHMTSRLIRCIHRSAYRRQQTRFILAAFVVHHHLALRGVRPPPASWRPRIPLPPYLGRSELRRVAARSATASERPRVAWLGAVRSVAAPCFRIVQSPCSASLVDRWLRPRRQTLVGLEGSSTRLGAQHAASGCRRPRHREMVRPLDVAIASPCGWRTPVRRDGPRVSTSSKSARGAASTPPLGARGRSPLDGPPRGGGGVEPCSGAVQMRTAVPPSHSPGRRHERRRPATARSS